MIDTIYPIEPMPMENINNKIAEAEAEAARLVEICDNTETPLSVPPFPTLETRVRWVTNALSNVEWVEPAEFTAGKPVLQPCPSLLDTSRTFSLNDKQHEALVKFGSKLLESFIHDVELDQQLLGFLGGKPGAGKNQVIHALQVLAQMWGKSDAVATGAYQGIAAQNTDGHTIHKLFGWRVNCDQSKWKPTIELMEKFHKVKLLIINEISTCDVHTWKDRHIASSTL